MAYCFVAQNQKISPQELTSSSPYIYHQSSLCSYCNEQSHSCNCSASRSSEQQHRHNAPRSDASNQHLPLDDLTKFNQNNQYTAYELSDNLAPPTTAPRQESELSRSHLSGVCPSAISSSSTGSSPSSITTTTITTRQQTSLPVEEPGSHLAPLREEATMRNSISTNHSTFSSVVDYVVGHQTHHQTLYGQAPHDLFQSSNDWNMNSSRPVTNEESSTNDMQQNQSHSYHFVLKGQPIAGTTIASKDSYTYLQPSQQSDQVLHTKSPQAKISTNNIDANDFNNNDNHASAHSQQQLSFANLTPISCRGDPNEIYYNQTNEAANFNQQYDFHNSRVTDGSTADARGRVNNYLETSRNSASSSPHTQVCANNHHEYIYYLDPQQQQQHHHPESHYNQQLTIEQHNQIQDQQNQQFHQVITNESRQLDGVAGAPTEFQNHSTPFVKYFESDYGYENQQEQHSHHEPLAQNQHIVHHYASQADLTSSRTILDQSAACKQQLQVDNTDPIHMKIKMNKPRSRRGRPRKKGSHSKITGKLWEFIRDLLLSERTNPSFIRWERHEDGVFKFVQSDKVAKMWGERKQNPKMTYEKLSRAMRYYYKSKVLLPVFGRRLVYKFGPNATGWLNAPAAATNAMTGN